MLKLLEKLGLSQTCSNTESERFLSTVRDRPAKAENDATSFASVSNNLVAIVLSFSVSPTLQQLNQYETYKTAKTWSEPPASAVRFFPIREFVAVTADKPLSLLTELRVFPTAFDLQTFRSYGATSIFYLHLGSGGAECL